MRACPWVSTCTPGAMRTGKAPSRKRLISRGRDRADPAGDRDVQCAAARKPRTMAPAPEAVPGPRPPWRGRSGPCLPFREGPARWPATDRRSETGALPARLPRCARRDPSAPAKAGCTYGCLRDPCASARPLFCCVGSREEATEPPEGEPARTVPGGSEGFSGPIHAAAQQPGALARPFPPTATSPDAGRMPKGSQARFGTAARVGLPATVLQGDTLGHRRRHHWNRSIPRHHPAPIIR